jgi:flavin reductase
MDSTDEGFRQGMRRLASGVSLITTAGAEQGQRHGMAATAVTSVTAAPPTLLVCINRDASLLAPLLAAGQFCVNVLSADQHQLPMVFADPALRTERFSHGDWYDEGGVPVLRGAEVSFVCEVAEHSQVGSHAVVFGRVIAVPELCEKPHPLIWHEGAGRMLAGAGSAG